MGPAEIAALSALAAEARARATPTGAAEIAASLYPERDEEGNLARGAAAIAVLIRDEQINVPALADGVAALVAALAEATARAERAEAFARDCRDNYDCDPDAHRYGTSCRACNAAALLGPEVKP